jgi:hypothetical protein
MNTLSFLEDTDPCVFFANNTLETYQDNSFLLVDELFPQDKRLDYDKPNDPTFANAFQIYPFFSESDTWKCQQCGILEKDTPYKRIGPDGTRVS